MYTNDSVGVFDQFYMLAIFVQVYRCFNELFRQLESPGDMNNIAVCYISVLFSSSIFEILNNIICNQKYIATTNSRIRFDLKTVDYLRGIKYCVLYF